MATTKKAAAPKRKKLVVPKSLAQCADLAYTLRQDRLVLQRDAEVIKKDEVEVKDYLIKNLPKSKASGVAGKIANARIESEDMPTITDKKKLLEYIRKTGDFDLITSSLNVAAVRERFDAKKKIPGVGMFKVVKVSLTKVG
jgi:hypothetical protein